MPIKSRQDAEVADASNRKAKVGQLYFPHNREEVQSLMRQMVATNTPLTMVGGRSGLTGGSIALHGGNAMDMSEFLNVTNADRAGYTNVSFKLTQGSGNFLLAKGKNQKTGIFPPGLTLKEMDSLLKPHDLFFASKPGYMGGEIGGATATNASGPRTLAFGDTRAGIAALEIVLPNGELFYARDEPMGKTFKLPGIKEEFALPDYPAATTKCTAGFYSGNNLSLTRWFSGSEGTTGAFAEIEVRLYPRRDIATRLYYFKETAQALGFAAELRELKYNLQRPYHGGVISIESMDLNGLSFVSDLIETNDVATAIEVEIFADDADTAQLVARHVKAFGGRRSPLSPEAIAEVRYTIPQRINAGMAERGLVKIASDFAVPANRFAEMYAAYEDTAHEMARITGDPRSSAMWGHIGDCHLHFNFLPNTEAAALDAQKLYEGLARKAVALGGTLSAEHGVGKKIIGGKPLLFLMNKPAYDYAAKVIALINPAQLLNRGNIIGYPGMTAIL